MIRIQTFVFPGNWIFTLLFLFGLPFSWTYVYNSKTWFSRNNITDIQFWNSLVLFDGLYFNGSLSSILVIPRIQELEDRCDLIFPMDDILKSDDSEANATDPVTASDCFDEDLEKKIRSIYWIDPRNWKSISNTDATPHTERIPCRFDGVRIANNSNTFIVLPPNPIELKMLSFGKKYIANRDFKKQAVIENFLKHFLLKSAYPLSEMFNITSSSCTNREGCLCGNHQYEEEICSLVKDDCPTELPCNDPIKPFGHCCQICASVLIVFYNPDKFVYKKLEAALSKFIEDRNEKIKLDLIYHQSKVERRVVQIIIMLDDNKFSKQVAEMAQDLKIILMSKSNLGIDEVITSDSVKEKVFWKTWLVEVVEIGIIVGVIGVVFYTLLYSRIKKAMQMSFSFAKFENVEETANKNLFKEAEITSSKNLQTEKENKPQVEVSNLIDNLT